jgi:hypothetical protein
MVMLRFLSLNPVVLAFPPPPPLLLFARNLPCRLAADALSGMVNSDLLFLHRTVTYQYRWHGGWPVLPLKTPAINCCKLLNTSVPCKLTLEIFSQFMSWVAGMVVNVAHSMFVTSAEFMQAQFAAPYEHTSIKNYSSITTNITRCHISAPYLFIVHTSKNSMEKQPALSTCMDFILSGIFTVRARHPIIRFSCTLGTRGVSRTHILLDRTLRINLHNCTGMTFMEGASQHLFCFGT